MSCLVQTTTTTSLDPAVKDFTIFVMEWALRLYSIMIDNSSHVNSYLDWVLCLDTLAGRAATVARFMYRETESVGEGDRLDTAAVHSWE